MEHWVDNDSDLVVLAGAVGDLGLSILGQEHQRFHRRLEGLAETFIDGSFLELFLELISHLDHFVILTSAEKKGGELLLAQKVIANNLRGRIRGRLGNSPQSGDGMILKISRTLAGGRGDLVSQCRDSRENRQVI